jgi:hypothetical protein
MPQGNVFSRIANGNILVATFVKPDSTTPNRVINCSANTDHMLGISQENGYLPPIPQATTPQYAAIAAVELKIYGVGCDNVLLAIGSGGCTAGDMLTSDGSGNGVTASAANICGAIADETRLINEWCRVTVTPPTPFS